MFQARLFTIQGNIYQFWESYKFQLLNFKVHQVYVSIVQLVNSGYGVINNINTYNVNRILKVEIYSKTASLVQILEDLDFPSSKEKQNLYYRNLQW